MAPLARSQPHGGRPQELLRRSLKQFAENNGFQAGIWYDGPLAGVVGYHGIDWQNRSTTLGYWLGKEYQGKGLMTAACRALVDHALEELSLNRVGMACAIENERSCAICEGLGFQQEGVQRQAEWLYDHFVDHALYAVLARVTKTLLWIGAVAETVFVACKVAD